MDSLISQGLRICGCFILFCGAYYRDVWKSSRFPFLSQTLLTLNSRVENPIQWHQTTVIGSDNFIDPVALEAQGLPYFATTYALNLLVTNMSVTAVITHLFLWNQKEMMTAFAGFAPAKLRRTLDPPHLDYRLREEW